MLPRRTFYLESLGCAKNQVDAEGLAAALIDIGWTWLSDSEEAELLLINTCGFIEEAKRQSLDTALEYRRRFPQKIIALTGCLAQRYGPTLFSELPELQGVFGNRDLGKIGDFAEALRRGERVLLVPEGHGAQPVRKGLFSHPGSAYVKTAEGCSNFCSYCAIPLIRGSLRSRPRGEVVEEVKRLADQGIWEVNLVAQDLASYGTDRGPGELPRLLEELGSLAGDFRIRLLYLHPEHFPRDLLPWFKSEDRFFPYFDLPFQHASPAVLKAMGRRGTAEQNLALLEEIRAELPGAFIRSTFLVGFPGEAGEDFEDLLAFQEKARLDWLGVFTYSPEEDTPAFKLHKRLAVPKKLARDRKAKLEAQQAPITAAALDRLLGRTLDILIEEPLEGEPLALGRSFAQAPEVDGLIVVHGRGLGAGKVVAARITCRNGVDLEAVPVQDGTPGGRE